MTSSESTSNPNQRLAEFIADEFLVRGYEWKFSEDDSHIPNADDLMDAFEVLKATTPDRHYQVAGHLIVVNSDGHFDVYVHSGEIQ